MSKVDLSNVRVNDIPQFSGNPKSQSAVKKFEKQAYSEYVDAVNRFGTAMVGFLGGKTFYVGTQAISDGKSLVRAFPVCEDVKFNWTDRTQRIARGEVQGMFDDLNRCIDYVAAANFGTEALTVAAPKNLEAFPELALPGDLMAKFQLEWGKTIGQDMAISIAHYNEWAKGTNWDYGKVVFSMKRTVALTRIMYARMAKDDGSAVKSAEIPARVKVKVGKKTEELDPALLVDSGKKNVHAKFTAFVDAVRADYYKPYLKVAADFLGVEEKALEDLGYFDAKLNSLSPTDRTGQNVLNILKDFEAFVNGLRLSKPAGGAAVPPFPEAQAKAIEALPVHEEQFIAEQQAILTPWFEKNALFLGAATDIIKSHVMNPEVDFGKFMSDVAIAKGFVEQQRMKKRVSGVEQRLANVEKATGLDVSSPPAVGKDLKAAKEQLIDWIEGQAAKMNKSADDLVKELGLVSATRVDKAKKPLPINTLEELEAELKVISDDKALTKFVAPAKKWAEGKATKSGGSGGSAVTGSTIFGSGGSSEGVAAGVNDAGGSISIPVDDKNQFTIDTAIMFGLPESIGFSDLKKGSGASIGSSVSLQTLSFTGEHNLGKVTVKESAGLADGAAALGVGVAGNVWESKNEEGKSDKLKVAIPLGFDANYSFYDFNGGGWSHAIQLKGTAGLKFPDYGVSIKASLTYFHMFANDSHGTANKVGGGVKLDWDGTKGGTKAGAKIGVSYSYNDFIGNSQRMSIVQSGGHNFGAKVGYYSPKNAPWGNCLLGIDAFLNLNVAEMVADINATNTEDDAGVIKYDTYGIVTGLGLLFKVDKVNLRPWGGISYLTNSTGSRLMPALGLGFEF